MATCKPERPSHGGGPAHADNIPADGDKTLADAQSSPA
jgi:hypothetical protein